MKEKDRWEGLIEESRRRDMEWAGLGVKRGCESCKREKVVQGPLSCLIGYYVWGGLTVENHVGGAVESAPDLVVMYAYISMLRVHLCVRAPACLSAQR